MKNSECKAGIEKFTEQAAKLVKLLDYQDNSIVSRTLIDKSSGTLTLFAFDKEQGLSEHTAPFDALVYIIDGEAVITIAGKPIQVKQGEMAIMPADQPHALKATSRFKMMLVMIKS
ncbi:cupin domain-containing protein [Chloroflexota bacterium]